MRVSISNKSRLRRRRNPQREKLTLKGSIIRALSYDILGRNDIKKVRQALLEIYNDETLWQKFLDVRKLSKELEKHGYEAGY